MKFLSILTIFLIFIIAAHAIPVQHLTKSKFGPEVTSLGVRFKDLYQTFTNQVKKVDKKFDFEIAKFNKVIPEAAKKDNTDKKSVEWLLTWNSKYERL
ncbi:6896_t:CDS:1, partial [Ambispora leptoticha]